MGVSHDDFNKSDHHPIVIDTEYQELSQHRIPLAAKQFEARWFCEEAVDVITQTTWERAKRRPSSLAQRTPNVHDSLHRWDNEVLKGPRTHLRNL